jgi:kynurenine formamidase
MKLISMVISIGVLAGSVGAAGLGGAGQAIDLSRSRLVDLTHPYNAQTIYWPTASTRFALEKLAYGPTPGGYFYSAYSFSTPEHGGTHLDAPVHFSERGRSADQVPLAQLIAPAVVIDVSAKADADPDYRLSPDDVLSFERQHGRIAPGTIVLLRTGWSRRWPDVKSYLGDDTPGDASRLRFPSYGEEAARLLVGDRRAGVLGVDTASIDYGRSTDFAVHRVAAEQQVAGLENLTNLNDLPAIGATVIALPIKIEAGSGGPVRVVAVVPGR